MLVVLKSSGKIVYEGTSRQDCLDNLPKDKNNYDIIPKEKHEDYIEMLVEIYENSL